MKKVLFFGMVLFFAFTAAAFADRAGIDGVIKSFEAIVVEAEKLAEMPQVNTGDFTALDDKAKAAETAINALADEREWAIQDARQLAALKARFNQAIATVAQKLLKY